MRSVETGPMNRQPQRSPAGAQHSRRVALVLPTRHSPLLTLTPPHSTSLVLPDLPIPRPRCLDVALSPALLLPSPSPSLSHLVPSTAQPFLAHRRVAALTRASVALLRPPLAARRGASCPLAQQGWSGATDTACCPRPWAIYNPTAHLLSTSVPSESGLDLNKRQGELKGRFPQRFYLPLRR
ncbi:hypothetical protein BKA80DRAFT_258731 [Phyllosticta citrichinensis]